MSSLSASLGRATIIEFVGLNCAKLGNSAKWPGDHWATQPPALRKNKAYSVVYTIKCCSFTRQNACEHFVCFNSSKTTGRTNLKLRTIDRHHPKTSVTKEVDGVTMMIKLKTNFIKFAFFWRRKAVDAKRKPASELPTLRNFTLLGSKMTSYFTTNRKICFIYFLKKYWPHEGDWKLFWQK